jgi:hypothetical protein
MANTLARPGFVPHVEALETRETPSASPLNTPVVITQNFDSTPVGSLPTGWQQWSTGGSFVTSSANAFSGTHSLATYDQSGDTARAWMTATLPADLQVSANFYINSLTPSLIFLRGRNLYGNSPTFYALDIRRGLYAQLLRVVNGQATILSSVSSATWVSGEWLNIHLSATGNQLQVQIYRPSHGMYLNRAGTWQTTSTPAIQAWDAAITGPGLAGVGRNPGYAGTTSFDDFSVGYTSTANPPPPPPPTGPWIPHHYPNIRIAELAYSGLPIGWYENQLLRNSVDLVVSDVPSMINAIHTTAPSTPVMAYSNVSSLYGNLLTDWLNYADTHNVSREAAFYHVAQATPFWGNSPSSQPVNWFWGVYLAGSTPNFVDVTTTAHSASWPPITLGGQGTSLYIGYTDPFREINFNLRQGAQNGWSGVLEYPTAVDSQGNPTAWAPLSTLSNTTGGLRWSGQILFDPPANWKTSIAGGTTPLYYVRLRTLTNGTPPSANTILGADYVNAGGGTRGVIPAFDYAADWDHDGYLNNAEYAHRTWGMDARFAYQSRLFYASYGQMRFAANPSNWAFRAWAVNYTTRFLNSQSGVGGLFMDNSSGNPYLGTANILESVATYSQDYGATLKAIERAVAPRWILANTAGGATTADGVVSQTTGYFEEFGLRPLAQNFQQFEDLAALVAHRANLRSPTPYAVLDSLPTNGSPTDPRTQLATLAEYYLIGDPNTTFLDPYGGFEPGTSWSRHWIPAAAYNIGQPRGTWSVFASGADPGNRALTYRVYQRQYSNALVLYKPLSYGSNSTGSLSTDTATTFWLGGTYRPLQSDGTLGSPITRITLQNGQGAILIP